MAYSSGFNPHPRISYVGAAPTGAASDAEYFEIGVSRPCDPSDVKSVLNQHLPDGFRIVSVAVASGIKLANRLEASQWRLHIPDASPAAVAEAVAGFLAADRVLIMRQSKKKERQINVREQVLQLKADATTVLATIRHSEPTIRPDELFEVLQRFSHQLGEIMLAHRLIQGPLGEDGTIKDPLSS